MLMSAVASAQTQGLQRPPPPGQPTGPAQPATPVPGYTGGPNYGNNGNGAYSYDEWEGPEGFRRQQGVLAVVNRDGLMDRLARMEEQLGRAMERADRGNGRDVRELRDALRQVREEMKGMRSDINNAADLRYFRRRSSPPPAPPPAPVPQVQPISEGQLQQLLNAIAKESFGDGKVRVVESAAPSQFFLVSQVQRVLAKFSFGDDKLDAARALWPRVLDRENAYNLYSSFNFQGEKDKLKDIIGR
jgi:hypothetical protein